MKTSTYSDLTLRAAVKAVKECGSTRKAAAFLGISKSEVHRRIVESERRADAKAASRAGLNGTDPVLEGFEIKQTTRRTDANGRTIGESITQVPAKPIADAIPAGHVVKGVSVFVDGDGRQIGKWIKTREGVNPTEFVDMLKSAFAGFAPFAPPVPKPKGRFLDELTLYPLPDLHMGMYSWAGETGENWDLGIAERAIGGAMERLVTRAAPTHRAVVLGGGDAMHADNNDNRTARSGNSLQVDGRYAKVLMATCKMFVKIIDLALTKHAIVDVRVLQGNHDEHASFAISYFLLAWYRDEPRVNVDADASLFWWYRFGKTFLGATHGHAAKPKNMPQIMATRRAKDWGDSVHRYIHMFHIHHVERQQQEDGGVIVEAHQAPCPQDGWHYGEGFLSGRSLQFIVYSPVTGEIGRQREPFLSRELEAA